MYVMNIIRVKAARSIDTLTLENVNVLVHDNTFSQAMNDLKLDKLWDALCSIVCLPSVMQSWRMPQWRRRCLFLAFLI